MSAEALQETSPLGSWHGHLFTLDRRQCVMFCHDTSRYVLFMAGLRKAHFAELGSPWFRRLYTATLAMSGCSDAQIRRAELALGPARFDTAIDRSVQGSLRIARQDLEAWVYGVPNVMDLDPVALSCRLNERPTTIRGQWLWPRKVMLEAVTAL
ncbi:hypothetical protein BI364_01200 [Acidihalobacter yilgarnensis]|uniref:DUF6933 domain-containing protein n=1 Tax=Acidihalobacter yilgarnensis TaxID=2819280 RepID=A0A1D8IK48_9GAMM|nr:hypothetical protein [Acidihalobacter yilgarnensis]AOU96804.1 hypothetical protein BI364_01200 [Acidihalobacter yilgarnensis]